MKIFKYISIIILSLFAFASCQSDLEKVFFNPADVVASKLYTIDKSYVLEEDNKDEVLDTVRWTRSKFGVQAPIIYNLEIVEAGKDFKSAIVLASTTTDTTTVVTVEQLNNAIHDMYAKMGDTLTSAITRKFELRIASTLGEAVAPVYSDTISTTITTYYVPPKPVYPLSMYMIGADFGDWNWNSTGVVEMVPVNGTVGTFWCVRYFQKDNGFKWSPEKAWGKDFYELDESVGYTVKDNNAFVPANGMYIVYMDLVAKKITIESAKIYGMGECFGGWNAGEYPFIVDANGRTMSITTKSRGELRMYAASPVTTDWWRMEFIILDGKISYRGNGDDQDRVTVNPDKKITLDFNAGTGTIN